MEDTSKLVKAIQIIVQEEVKRHVQKIIKTGIKPIVKEEIERYFGRQKLAEIKNNKPSILDESVVYDSSNYEDIAEWPTMKHNISPRNSSPRVHMEGMDDLMGVGVGSNVDLSDPATKAVAAAMTRDYSQLMKAMNKRNG